MQFFKNIFKNKYCRKVGRYALTGNPVGPGDPIGPGGPWLPVGPGIPVLPCGPVLPGGPWNNMLMWVNQQTKKMLRSFLIKKFLISDQWSLNTMYKEYKEDNTFLIGLSPYTEVALKLEL